MARPKKVAAPAKKWTYQVGLKPHTVTATERTDKKNVVTIRWWNALLKRYDTKSTGIFLRDAQGRIDATQETAAQDATRAAYQSLLAGVVPGTASVVSVQGAQSALTLEQGFARAFLTPSGMYEDPKDEHYIEMTRYKNRVLKVLPSHTTWASVLPSTYTALWRGLIALYKTEGVGGLPASMRCGVILSQTARWLSKEQAIPHGAALPDSKWEVQLTEAWRKSTGERDTPEPPRHTEEELGRLFVAAYARRADPRVCTAFILGAEGRLGQVVRARRSQLDLGEVGANGLGMFHVPDYGKKGGVDVDLTQEMRAHIDHEMLRGYLFLLESEYQRAVKAGRTFDYALFPGEKLRAGVARVDVLQELGDRALIDMFHHLERKAGVAIVAGRGWNGVRRLATDLAEDYEGDERALNRMSGHKSSDTRRKVYQKKRRDVDAVKTTNARTALRAGAIAVSEAAGPAQFPPDGPGQRAYEQVQEDKRQRRRDLHTAVAAQKKLDTAGQPRRYRGKGKPKDLDPAAVPAGD